MALLADLAAYDFGYCSAAQLLCADAAHFRNAVAHGTLSRALLQLVRHAVARAAASPQYVSMVDSGNLAANLLVLASGCAELSEARVLPPRMFGGLRDTLRVLLDVARGTEGPLVGAAVLRKIERQIEDLDDAPAALGAAYSLLSRLTIVAAELSAAAGSDAEVDWWAKAYERSCLDHQTDLLHLAAWLALPAPPEGFWERGAGEQVERLSQLRETLQRLDTAATLRDVADLPAVCAAAGGKRATRGGPVRSETGSRS